MGRPPSYDHTMLLREIIDCLWERGYAATPISVIVQETGVNAASLYARFGSKKGIMLAALDLYAKETIDALEALLAATQPGAGQVRAILEHAMGSFEDPRARGCFLVNTVTNISTDTPDFAMAYFFIRSLEKALEPSRIAAFLRGPNPFSPRASNTSLGPQSHGPDAP